MSETTKVDVENGFSLGFMFSSGVCWALLLSILSGALFGFVFDRIGDGFHWVFGGDRSAYVIVSEGKTYFTKDYRIRLFSGRIVFDECGTDIVIYLSGSDVSVTKLTGDYGAVAACYPAPQVTR